MMLHSGLDVVLMLFLELIMEEQFTFSRERSGRRFSSLNIFVHRANKNGRIESETPQGVVFLLTEQQPLDPYRKEKNERFLEQLTADKKDGSTLVGPIFL